MLRVYVRPTAREFLLCDALKASLRAAHYEIVETLEGDVPVHVVIVSVESVDDSCRLVSSVLTRRPSARVVALGDRCSEEDIVTLVEAGVKAYVDRTQSVAQLLFTVDAVVRQRTPANGRLTAQVIRKIQYLSGEGTPSAGIEVLTERERAILRLIGLGCSNKEIASRLSISCNTVKNHVHRVLEKLHVHGRREAARVALASAVFRPLAAPARHLTNVGKTA